jgi:hypothetical protein
MLNRINSFEKGHIGDRLNMASPFIQCAKATEQRFSIPYMEGCKM